VNATKRTDVNGRMHSVAFGSVRSKDDLIKAFDNRSNSSGSINLHSSMFDLYNGISPPLGCRKNAKHLHSVPTYYFICIYFMHPIFDCRCYKSLGEIHILWKTFLFAPFKTSLWIFLEYKYSVIMFN